MKIKLKAKCLNSQHYYRPQRSWGKVMFLHVSNSVHGGGSASVHAGIPPPQYHGPPQEQTPCPRDQVPPLGPGTPWDQAHPPGAVHAGTYGKQAGGTHPTGMRSCYYGNLPEEFSHFNTLADFTTVCTNRIGTVSLKKNLLCSVAKEKQHLPFP